MTTGPTLDPGCPCDVPLAGCRFSVDIRMCRSMPAYVDRRFVGASQTEVAHWTETFVETVHCRGESETHHGRFLML